MYGNVVADAVAEQHLLERPVRHLVPQRPTLQLAWRNPDGTMADGLVGLFK